MTVAEGPRTSSLVTRAQNILMRPTIEWDVIAREPATVAGLYTGYACILAAIPPIATIIGAVAFGHAFAIAAIVGAVLSYVLSLVGLFITALIVDALAPSFGAERSQVQALKLVTYSSTAVWLAGALNIVPVLGALATIVGGLYSLYLIYLGLPRVMKCPADKTVAYLLVTVVVAFVVYFVIGLVVSMVIGMLAIGAIATGVGAAALSAR